jgi:type I restriction enzyme S subunit
VNEWQETTLQDVVSVLGDGLHGTPIYDDNGEYYFVNGNNLSNGKILLKESTRRASVDEYLKYKKPLNDRTILLSINGTLGNVALYNNEKCFLGKSACYFNIKESVDKQYIRYVVTNKSFQTYISEFAHGTTIQNLSLKTLREFPFELPPLEEQKAIASVLSSLDDKIDLLHSQNTTLERMAETLFRQWFVEEAQEDWEEVPLDKLVNITSSKRIFYSEYVTSGVPFYRSKEIIELHNTGSTNSELFISEARFNEISNKFGAPKENDILLTSVGTLGIPYKVKKSDRFYFKDGNLTWFKDFTGMPAVIIYCWLKSSIGKEQLDSITIGSTQAALTISGLKQIIFKIPPKEIIKMAEEKLTAIYSKIEGNQKQIKTLEKLRENLLPKLMSGEVRVLVGADCIRPAQQQGRMQCAPTDNA